MTTINARLKGDFITATIPQGPKGAGRSYFIPYWFDDPYEIATSVETRGTWDSGISLIPLNPVNPSDLSDGYKIYVKRGVDTNALVQEHGIAMTGAQHDLTDLLELPVLGIQVTATPDQLKTLVKDDRILALRPLGDTALFYSALRKTLKMQPA